MRKSLFKCLCFTILFIGIIWNLSAQMDDGMAAIYKNEFISKLPKLSLPFSAQCGFDNLITDIETREAIRPFTPAGYEVYGVINKLDSIYLLICLEKNEQYYPHLFMFDLRGTLICHKNLYNNNCINGEVITTKNHFKIDKELNLTITDSLIFATGKQGIDSCRVLIESYKLTHTGVDYIGDEKGAVSYANELSDCFSKEDIMELNKGCMLFENVLRRFYGEQDMGLNYKRFLIEYGNYQLSKDLVLELSATEHTQNLMIDSLFYNIWEKYKEPESNDLQIVVIEQETDYKIDESYKDFFVNKKDGIFQNCLTKNTTNTSMKEILMELESVPGVSMGIVAGAISGSFNKQDYNVGLTRLFIAYRFYYETKVNIIHRTNLINKK